MLDLKNNPPDQTMPSPQANARHFVTLGEHRFNLRVYRSIGWFTNAALSVGAVVFAERTHTGQQVMRGLGDLFVAGTRWMGMKAETARYLAAKTFYLTGGFAVMVPMKRAEDKKVERVKAWNREIYGEEEVARNPEIQQSERELEAAPKQTWRSILSARVLALVPFYITVGALWDRSSWLSRLTKETVYIDRPLTWLTRNIGRAAAWIGGNKEAGEQIVRMQKEFPGVLREGAIGSANRDPIHSALPHYVLSESITSGMVAAGVYLITRITGPFFGKSKAERAQEVRAAEPAAAIFRSKHFSSATNDNAPATTITAQDATHEAPDRALAAQRA